MLARKETGVSAAGVFGGVRRTYVDKSTYAGKVN